MKYRKLRIAWSVAWGVVGGLVIILSLWSVRHRELVLLQNNWTLALRKGRTVYFQLPNGPGPWKSTDFPLAVGENESLFAPVSFGNTRGGPYATVPCWCYILVSCALYSVLGIFPPLHFSLRTLLIATTLVAVVLGLVVWASR